MTNPHQPYPFSDPPADAPPPAWREGALVITPRQARIAHACVRCGEPTHKLQRLKLSWHEPAWVLLVLASPLVYVIVALAISKRAQLEVGLCERHARRRARTTAVGWGGVLGGFAAFLLAIPAESVGLVLAGALALITGVIVLAARRLVSAARMDKDYVWLKGVSPRIVHTLPPSFALQPRELPRAWMRR